MITNDDLAQKCISCRGSSDAFVAAHANRIRHIPSKNVALSRNQPTRPDRHVCRLTSLTGIGERSQGKFPWQPSQWPGCEKIESWNKTLYCIVH